MFGRGIYEKYQSRDDFRILKFYEIFEIIPPYIRMLSSDWLMKGVFFLPILRFFSFSTTTAGIFA
jgi:hypothetical protein